MSIIENEKKIFSAETVFGLLPKLYCEKKKIYYKRMYCILIVKKSMLQYKKCIAGWKLYCRQKKARLEVYCNTLGCIAEKKAMGLYCKMGVVGLELYCNTVIVLQAGRLG